MKYYFAPLEGITDSIYRKLHNEFFPGLTCYYTPFLSPTIHRELTSRELREIPPADTINYSCVPQMLTKVPDDFLWMAQQCKNLGYTEVNLNLGCPSGTVTAKGKGSAMLEDLSNLDCFLDTIFSGADIAISIKTRIGYHTSDAFPKLMEIFNRYPVKELIIHPRVRDAFYNGVIDKNIFSYALNCSTNPVCFNGNLNSVEEIRQIAQQHPNLKAVMLGRGLVGNPGMLSEDKSPEKLYNFHTALLDAYLSAFGGSRNAMFRMKENWRYMICLFEDCEKLKKRLRKTTDIEEYRVITHEIFHTVPMRNELKPDW